MARNVFSHHTYLRGWAWMDMSVPCKCHSCISVGDELLARSGLKSIERYHRRGKKLSSASCEMWVSKLKP